MKGTASYGCKPGFYLDGAATRTCQASGSWSGVEPTCQDAHTKDLRLVQLHIGSGDFVSIRNTGNYSVTLIGVHVELRDSANTFSYDFAEGALAIGAEARVGGGGTGSQYAFAFSLEGSRGAAIMLCATKPCTVDTVLDAFTYRAGIDPPPLPTGVSINEPVLGIDSTNEDAEDFYRIAYEGTTPRFSSCDWSAGPLRPIFAESFECGDTRWSTTGGTWLVVQQSSPDGSGSVIRQTVPTGDTSVGKEFVFPSAVFPTHVEYWMRGGNATYICSAVDTCSGAGSIGGTFYRDYKNSLCWAGGVGSLSCVDQGDDWDFVELDEIDWNQGTLKVRINGVELVPTAPSTRLGFGTNFTRGAGLRKVFLTGGGSAAPAPSSTWDGIRMW